MRYGDFLRDFANPATSVARKNEIVRLFNELGDRDQKYRTWLQFANSSPKLDHPTITSPNWVNSPLHAFILYRQADLTVANDTDVYIQHDQARNFGNVFEGYIEDTNGTRVRRGSNFDGVAMAFRVDGFAIWAGNATGYRGLWIESFDANNSFLARSPLHTAAGHNLIDNVLPFSFTWFYDNGANYVKLKVHQTSGGNLTLKEFYAAFTLA